MRHPAEPLPSAGSQLAADTGNGGVLLTRGEDGMVRAFANIPGTGGMSCCRAGSAASAKAIVCPYHSWAYSLSGELRGAPGFRGLDTGGLVAGADARGGMARPGVRRRVGRPGGLAD